MEQEQKCFDFEVLINIKDEYKREQISNIIEKFLTREYNDDRLEILENTLKKEGVLKECDQEGNCCK